MTWQKIEKDKSYSPTTVYTKPEGGWPIGLTLTVYGAIIAGFTIYCLVCATGCAPGKPTQPTPEPVPVCYLTDGQGNVLTDELGNKLTCE